MADEVKKRLCFRCDKEFEISKLSCVDDIEDEDILVEGAAAEIYFCVDCLDEYLQKTGWKECERCCKLSNTVSSIITKAATMYDSKGDPGDPAEYEDMCRTCCERMTDEPEPEY